LGRALTGIVVGICTLELVIDAGIATGMVWPLGNCKSTGKVPDTGLKEQRKEITMIKTAFAVHTRKSVDTLKIRVDTNIITYSDNN